MTRWAGELRLMAIDADRIVFYRIPDDEIKLTIGRRYGCAFVEIADNEAPAPNEPERTGVKRAMRQPSNQAAILAKRREFQHFAARRMRETGAGALPPNEETATEYIRRTCGVSSRADLDSNPAAYDEYQRIELEFYRQIDDSRA